MTNKKIGRIAVIGLALLALTGCGQSSGDGEAAGAAGQSAAAAESGLKSGSAPGVSLEVVTAAEEDNQEAIRAEADFTVEDMNLFMIAHNSQQSAITEQEIGKVYNYLSSGGNTAAAAVDGQEKIVAITLRSTYPTDRALTYFEDINNLIYQPNTEVGIFHAFMDQVREECPGAGEGSYTERYDSRIYQIGSWVMQIHLNTEEGENTLVLYRA